ncbi:MAG: hypothetical protein KDA87_22460 [Planctomycetales bacterium]|nr:hypothetical protein [Planctomycetales bacterium]
MAKNLRWLAVVAGAASGIVGALLVIRSWGEPLPPIVHEPTLEAQRKLWEALAVQDYRIRIQVDGANPGVYEVEVQDGQPVSSTFRDKPLTNSRTMGTWTVPGMFRTIELDLYHRSQADRDPRRLAIRASFDPDWHYPDRMVRTDLDTNQGANWKVLQFERLPTNAGTDRTEARELMQ